jgi:DNA-binding Lrp family transcriptional regulator
MKVIVQQNEDAIKTFRLLSNLTIKNIVEYLKRNGPSPPSKIARELNISPSTVSRCLQELRRYNVVKAKWKTISIDERPIKIYRLVPNVLRFEFVINEPRIDYRGKRIIFNGTFVSDFKERGKKGVYVSLDNLPFRFEGVAGEIIREISRSEYTFEELENKFGEAKEDFRSALKYLLTFGLIELRSEEQK